MDNCVPECVINPIAIYKIGEWLQNGYTTSKTSPDGAVAMSCAGRYWVRISVTAPTWGFKGPMGRCKGHYTLFFLTNL